MAGLASVTDDALDAVCKDVDMVWLQGAWEVGAFGRRIPECSARRVASTRVFS